MRRVGELHGTIDVPGAKNAVLKLMAATILADGEYELTNVPAIADVRILGDLLEAIGVRSWSPAPGRAAPVQRRRPRARRPLRARRAHPGLDQRARAAAHPVRSGPPLDARRRRLRCPPDRHARRRSRADGCDVQVQPRRARGDRRAAARRRRHVPVPERRGDREHRHGGGVRRRRDDDRQRGPRARGRRSLPDARRDGRRHRRASGRPRSSSAASSAARCTRRTTARCPIASRPRRTSPRSPSPAAS